MLPSLLLLLLLPQQVRKSLLHPAPAISGARKPIKVFSMQRGKTCYNFQVQTLSSYPSNLCSDTHGIMKYHFTFLKSSEKMDFTLQVCAHVHKKLMVNFSLKHSIVVFCWKEIIKEAKQYQSTENSHLCPQSTSFYTQRSTKSIW